MQYFNNRIIEHKSNIIETWKITNELLNKCKKFTNITFLKDRNVGIQGKKEIPNAMNIYFRSVIEDLAGKIDESANSLLGGDYTVNLSKFKFPLL